MVGKNLKEVFFDALDEFAPRLMDLFSKKKGLAGQLLADLLRQTKVSCIAFYFLITLLFFLSSLLFFLFPFCPFFYLILFLLMLPFPLSILFNLSLCHFLLLIAFMRSDCWLDQ